MTVLPYISERSFFNWSWLHFFCIFQEFLLLMQYSVGCDLMASPDQSQHSLLQYILEYKGVKRYYPRTSITELLIIRYIFHCWGDCSKMFSFKSFFAWSFLIIYIFSPNVLKTKSTFNTTNLGSSSGLNSK